MTTPLRHSLRLRPGLDLVLREAGQGGPVLVLHGAPGPGSVAPLVGHLAARHRVLAPTHPGWEESVRPAELDSVAALAVVYLELLDRLGLADVTVLGTSFGGWAAARMAVDDNAGRISRLVLMNAIGPRVPGQAVTLPSGPPPGPAPGEPRGGPPGDPFAALHAYTGPELGDPELLPRLSAVTCPVLVLWGADDTVVTPEFGRAYAAAFPHARFELVPGGRHLPIREQPEAVYAALDRFLTTPPADVRFRR